jgi:hypothetical protein
MKHGQASTSQPPSMPVSQPILPTRDSNAPSTEFTLMSNESLKRAAFVPAQDIDDFRQPIYENVIAIQYGINDLTSAEKLIGDV